MRQSSSCWVHEWDKVSICFIDIFFFAPGFECFVEKSGCMYIVVAEGKNLAVIDYLFDPFYGLFSVIELLKEVRNGCG